METWVAVMVKVRYKVCNWPGYGLAQYGMTETGEGVSAFADKLNPDLVAYWLFCTYRI